MARKIGAVDDVICGHLNLALLAWDAGRYREVLIEARRARQQSLAETSAVYVKLASALWHLAEVNLGGTAAGAEPIHWRQFTPADAVLWWHVQPILLTTASILPGDDGWQGPMAAMLADEEGLAVADLALPLLGIALTRLPEHPDWDRWRNQLERRAHRLPSARARAWLALSETRGLSGNLPATVMRDLQSCLPALRASEARELVVEVLLARVTGQPDHRDAGAWIDEAMAVAQETSSLPLVLKVRAAECDYLSLPLDHPANEAIEADRVRWIKQCGLLLYRMRPRQA